MQDDFNIIGPAFANDYPFLHIFAVWQGGLEFVGGVILGCCLGAGVAAAWGELTEFSQAYALFSPLLLGLVVLCSPVLSALVSWPPSVLAARQDPAVVLSRE